MIQDTELLQRYIQQASQEAFAELVRRHIDLVYAAALRRTNGQRALAEEAAQQAFVALAREARTLVQHPTLAGWLYVTARQAAGTLLRGEQSRQAREQEAHRMNSSHEPEAHIDWDGLRPEIEQLIEELDTRDRDAVVLRFFEGRRYAEIGVALALSEDAARMRIERALEKLRTLLARRGITSTAAALGAALGSQAIAAAPSGLAAAVTSAALAGGAAGMAPVAGLLTFMSTKFTVGAVGLLAVVAASFLAVERSANAGLRQEVEDLRKQVAQQQSLPKAPPTAAQPKIVASPAAAAPAAGQAAASAPSEKAMEQTPPASGDRVRMQYRGMVRAEAWQDRGTATPLATLETYLYAGDRIDLEARAKALGFGEWKPQVDEFFARLSPEIRAKHESPEKLWAFIIAGAPQAARVIGYEVLNETTVATLPTKVVSMQMRAQKEGGITDQGNMVFEQTADGWRYTLPKNLITLVFEMFPSAKVTAAAK